MKHPFLIRQLLILVFVLLVSSAFAENQNQIRPCEVWPDENGNHIQAHGGGIIKIKNTYYWYGEQRGQGLDPQYRYVSCYSSDDLTNWKFRGNVVKMLPPDSLTSGWVLERPKVFYNAGTHKYVMYFHLDDRGYSLAQVGVAVCDKPDGAFKFVKRFRPLGHESRDIGQFIDDDGTAYLVFEDRSYGFRIARLSKDFMDVEKEMSLISAHMEGGAIVHYNGLYYSIGSALTGWRANPNKYSTAPSLEGPWTEFKDIAPVETNTYGSQSTMLIKVTGTKKTSVIFMGDIWKPKTQWDSRYLWMPLEIGEGKLRLPEPKPWKLNLKTGETTLMPSDSLQKSTLEAYPAPQGVEQNTDFSVQVRIPGGQWQDLPEYAVKVDEVRGTDHAVENASMSYFDFSGEVEVSITYNKGTIQDARVRPLSYNIKPEIQGNTIRFKLSEARNLSVEVNGDIFHNLHLFANPMETFRPKKDDKNVLYFGPGIHEIPGEKLLVESGKTVYLAGGAVLRGQILIKDAEHVKILGRGMVDQKIKQGVRIANSKNVEVDGVFCTQCFTGGSDSVTIRNVKTMSYYSWGDGMNVISSNNVLIDGVFNRNSDDCTTVYGTRLGFTGGCKNITMQNSTLWADVAHPILVGTHGNTPNPELLEDLTYSNIDILDHKEAQIDYQGCLSLNAGDNNLIRNVRFENIRVENFRQGQLVNLRVYFNTKYCTSPGRGIENVLFKDITYNGTNAQQSIIAGYDGERKIRNIVFENLRINGKVISDDMAGKPVWFKTSDLAGFFVGEHVEGLQFRK